MNKKIIKGYSLLIGYMGYFMMLLGFIILLPLITILFYPESINQSAYFIVPGVTSIIIGYILSLILRGKRTANLERHQDAVLVLFVWIVAILVSSIPFLLTNEYNFTQAIFESTSGYSTTGLTVINVASTSKMFLLYRSLLQFFGGVGLVLVLTSAISDKYGMRLYHAEGHNDKLLPNLVKSARLILTLYIIYIVLGTLGYSLFGMSVFDGINHSITSVTTGGFSTQPDSIGHYNSIGIEYITIVLMILGSTNVIIHLFILRGKIKKVFHHIESFVFLIVIIIFFPLMMISIANMSNYSFAEGFRVTLFQFVSAITTTGFQTIDSFQSLPHIFNFSVIIMMIIGGGIGSTSGGIKQYRIGLEVKNLYWNIRDRLSHQRTLHTNYVKRFSKDTIVEKTDLVSNHAFITLYILVLIMGTIVFVSYGYTLTESLFEFSSALGTVGLSIGIIQYTTPNPLLWTSIIGMFLGRLEFYVVIIAFSKLVMDGMHKKVV